MNDTVQAVAARYTRYAEALQNGTLTEKEAETLRGGYAYVYKEGPNPVLAYANPNAAMAELANDNDGCMPFVVTTLADDRDGDVVVPMGCDITHYRNNPEVFFGHQQWEIPIGVCRNPAGDITVYIEEQRVVDNIYFDRPDPDADYIYGKCKRKILNATSIAFVPIEAYRREEIEKAKPYEGGKDHKGGWLFKRWDKTEVSIVGVPSNPYATRLEKDLRGALRDSLDKEKSYISPKLQKAMLPYCDNAKGKCWSGWCPIPEVSKAGTCKPGQTAANTDCIPASGEGSSAPKETSGEETESKTQPRAKNVAEWKKMLSPAEKKSIVDWSAGDAADMRAIYLGKDHGPDGIKYHPKTIEKIKEKLTNFLKALDTGPLYKAPVYRSLSFLNADTFNDILENGFTDKAPSSWTAGKNIEPPFAHDPTKYSPKNYIRIVCENENHGGVDIHGLAGAYGKMKEVVVPGGSQFVVERSEVGEYPSVSEEDAIKWGIISRGQPVPPPGKYATVYVKRANSASSTKSYRDLVSKALMKSCDCHDCSAGKTCGCSKDTHEHKDAGLSSSQEVKDSVVEYKGPLAGHVALGPIDPNKYTLDRGLKVFARTRLMSREGKMIPSGARLTILQPEGPQWLAIAQDGQTVVVNSGTVRRSLKMSRKLWTKDSQAWVLKADGMLDEEQQAVLCTRGIDDVHYDDESPVKSEIGSDEWAEEEMEEPEHKATAPDGVTYHGGSWWATNKFGQERGPFRSRGEAEAATKALKKLSAKKFKKDLAENTGGGGGYTVIPQSGEQLTTDGYTGCESCQATGSCGVCEGSGINELGVTCASCGGSGACPECLGEATMAKSVKNKPTPSIVKSLTKRFVVKTPLGYIRKDDEYTDDEDLAKDFGDEDTAEEAAKDIEGAEVEEAEPFEPKPSAVEAAKAYQKLKSVQDELTESLKSMDHPGMVDGMTKLTNEMIPKCMEHVKNVLHKNHGDGSSPDEFMDKCMKGLETSGNVGQGVETGESNLIDNGEVPPDTVQEGIDPNENTEEILERYQERGKWFTRKVGKLRVAKGGRKYLVRAKRWVKKGETDWCQTCDGYGHLDASGMPDTSGPVCPACHGSGAAHKALEEDGPDTEAKSGPVRVGSRVQINTGSAIRNGTVVHWDNSLGMGGIKFDDGTTGRFRREQITDSNMNDLRVLGGYKALDDDDMEAVKDASDLMCALSEDEQIPKSYNVPLKHHAKRLGSVHKALTNMGKAQANGGSGSPLTDTGKVEANGGGGSELSDEGEREANGGKSKSTKKGLMDKEGNVLTTGDTVANWSGKTGKIISVGEGWAKVRYDDGTTESPRGDSLLKKSIDKQVSKEVEQEFQGLMDILHRNGMSARN